MGARFQIEIERGSPSLFPCSLKGDDLGMGLSCFGMVPVPDDFATLHQNGTDHRIG
jgi:hypothetical protein